MKNLLTRSLTGLIYVAAIVAGILIGGPAFLLLQLLLVLPAVWEFGRLRRVGATPLSVTAVDSVGAIVLVSGLNLVSQADASWSFPVVGTAMTLYLIYVVARLAIELFAGGDTPIESLGHSFMGQMWIALPVALMAYLYATAEVGKWLMLTIFVMIWLNDTGAYCVGSMLGRHRLMERISPKKSWEGFWGGVAFAVLAGWGAWSLCPATSGAAVSLPFMLGLGAVVSFTGTVGDLVESMVKRSAGVKDSGNILPGHGGMLDRIDSLLLVVPSVFIYALLATLF